MTAWVLSAGVISSVACMGLLVPVAKSTVAPRAAQAAAVFLVLLWIPATVRVCNVLEYGTAAVSLVLLWMCSSVSRCGRHAGYGRGDGGG